MKVLVAGGCGYIGSHTCVELLNSGSEVVVIDNLSNSSPQSIERVREITGKEITLYTEDLLNFEKIDSIMAKENIDAVIHFAGLKAVGESVSIPIAYYENNIMSTINLINAMQKNNVKNIVFSSSATVYGFNETMPLKEDFPLSATSPYGRTKLMIEQILTDLYVSDKSFNIAILRYFNPIGAHKSGKIGEDPNGIPNNLVPYISKVAIGKLEKLPVYGNDYDTKDGTGVRDYLHVVDLVLGHLKALEKLEQNCGLVTYNLGTGNGVSVFELIAAFEKASGKTIPYQIVSRRPGDNATCYADASKALAELNWKAEKTIDEMCEDTWRWQKNNPNGYR